MSRFPRAVAALGLLGVLVLGGDPPVSAPDSPADPSAPAPENCTTTERPGLLGLYTIEQQACVGLEDPPDPTAA